MTIETPAADAPELSRDDIVKQAQAILDDVHARVFVSTLGELGVLNSESTQKEAAAYYEISEHLMQMQQKQKQAGAVASGNKAAQLLAKLRKQAGVLPEASQAAALEDRIEKTAAALAADDDLFAAAYYALGGQ